MTDENNRLRLHIENLAHARHIPFVWVFFEEGHVLSVARQIGYNNSMPGFSQQGNNLVPTPRTMPTTMNKEIYAHLPTPFLRSTSALYKPVLYVHDTRI